MRRVSEPTTLKQLTTVREDETKVSVVQQYLRAPNRRQSTGSAQKQVNLDMMGLLRSYHKEDDKPLLEGDFVQVVSSEFEGEVGELTKVSEGDCKVWIPHLGNKTISNKFLERDISLKFKQDIDLLLRESLRFDPRVLSVLKEIWNWTDFDKSGAVDEDEYVSCTYKEHDTQST